MTEHVFDANGWCSDMDAMPSGWHLLSLVVADSRMTVAGWRWERHSNGEACYRTMDDGFWTSVTHWKPLGPGPVGT